MPSEVYNQGSIVKSCCAAVKSQFFSVTSERSLLWNDPALGIEWPFEGEPKLAAKDAAARRLCEAETFD